MHKVIPAVIVHCAVGGYRGISDPPEKDRGRAYVAWEREYQAQLQYFFEVAEQEKKVYD